MQRECFAAQLTLTSCHSTSGTANVAELNLRWVQASVALPEGAEALLIPTAGSEATVRCRDPLSGGHTVQTLHAQPGQLLFVPSRLSCIGAVLGNSTLALVARGAVPRPKLERDPGPSPPMLDVPTVFDVPAQGGRDFFRHATQQFRLVQGRVYSLAAGGDLVEDAGGDHLQIV